MPKTTVGSVLGAEDTQMLISQLLLVMVHRLGDGSEVTVSRTELDNLPVGKLLIMELDRTKDQFILRIEERQ